MGIFLGAELVTTNPEGNHYRLYFDGGVHQRVLREALGKTGDKINRVSYVAKNEKEGMYHVELNSKKNLEQLKKTYRRF